MKIRTDYVTNSSSSSFIIEKKDLTPIQVIQLLNHHDYVEKMLASEFDYPTGWSIEDEGDRLTGYTSMDNFDMYGFLKHIGVDLSKVDFDY